MMASNGIVTLNNRDWG